MKKICALLFLFFCIAGMSQVHAAAPGLLFGKSISYGPSATNTPNTTTVFTDGNTTTGTKLQLRNPYMVYEFDQPVDISAYAFKATNWMNYELYSSKNDLVSSGTIKDEFNTNVKVNFGSTFRDVKRIVFYSFYGDNTLYEIDFYSPPGPPLKPLGLTGTASYGSVILDWNSVAGVDGYNVYKNGSKINGTLLTTNQYQASVPNNTVFTWKVSAVNALGESPLSDQISTNFLTTPANPMDFKVDSRTFESAKLSWKNPPDIDFKTIKIYNPGLVYTSTIENGFIGESRTVQINGLAADTNYTFRITASDQVGNESTGTTLLFKTEPLPDTTPPVEPAGLSAVPSNGKVVLTWTTLEGATGYNLKRSTTTGGPYTAVASNITESSYTDTTVTNGSAYYYIVTAMNAYGESSNSNEVSATPQAPLPSTPTAPTLIGQAGSSQNMLTWTASSGATSYDVKRSLTAAGPYTTISSSVYTNVYSTYTDTSVVNGTTYYYVVSAINAGGSSANSNEVSLKPQAPLEPTLNIVIAEEKVKVGQEFTANVELKDVTNIYAEDFTVKYDNTKFDYLGFEAVTGYQVYNQPTDQNGTLRFIIASQGVNYGITGEKTFVKLKLRAKAVGVGKVDALKCRLADIDHEFDLGDPSCGEDTVTVENQDVNRNGEYTLLDLAIDGYYYGQLATNANPAIYTAHQAGNEYVDDDDLLFIVKQMLLNTNYAPNL